MEQVTVATGLAEQAPGRVGGRRWILARNAWISLVVFDLLMFIMSIGPTFALLEQPCRSQNNSDCSAGQIALADWRAMQTYGITPTAYAVFALTVLVAVSLIFFAVGFLIAWRKWDDLMGLFVSATLITFGSTGISDSLTNGSGPAALGIVQFFIVALSYPALAIFLLTFPTGKFAPRWTAFIVVLWSLQFGLFNLKPPDGVLLLSVLSTWGSSIAVQVYRYRKVYAPLQRQQAKWVVFSLVVAILLQTVVGLAPNLWPSLNTPGSIYRLAGVVGLALFWSPISLGVGIAILRSRLYDIDLLINRAMVYGLLTAILAGLYAGGVIGGQRLVAAITGVSTSDSPLAIVLTTLVVAALFQPLRTRLQSLIDRRFYRRKYNAARAVAQFSSTLRSEVNLPDLSDHLVAIVDEAMRPEHVSLWLSPRADGSVAHLGAHARERGEA